MIISAIPWYYALIWAFFATLFYFIRYRKTETFKNPWMLALIFAANFFFFAFGVIIFILIEYIRYKRKKSS